MGKIALGKVDCDAETVVASQNSVSKYPTLKIYRHGVMAKKEYRGARFVNLKFVFENLVFTLKN